MHLSIIDIFDQSQEATYLHKTLITSLVQLYKSISHEEFWKQFTSVLKHLLVAPENKPAINNVFEFVAKFTAKIQEQFQPEDEENVDSINENFLYKILHFLLKHGNVSRTLVQVRICQLISQLLENLNDAELTDDLYEELIDGLLKHLKSRSFVVRVRAVYALSRLQDPSNENCPVVKEYLFHLENDPKGEVRRSILACIGASKNNLPVILGRTQDAKDNVRKIAYQFLAERVHIRSLTIAQRVDLLDRGLKDRSDLVKKFVARKLLPAWISFCEHSLLNFLSYLDVENSTETCELVLKTYFSSMNAEDLSKSLYFVSEKHLIPYKDLTCENVFLWRMVCQYFQESENDYVEYLEKFLPDLPPLCHYIDKYVHTTSVEGNDVLKFEYILGQLILLTGIHDCIDETAKRGLIQMIQRLLPIMCHTKSNLITLLVEHLSRAMNNDEKSIVTFLLEIISDIQEPIMECDLNATLKHQRDMELANVRLNLIETRERLRVAVQEENYTLAANLKSMLKQMEETESKAATLTQEMTQIMSSKEDKSSLLKCLIIVCEMLKLPAIITLSPTIEQLIDSMIIPGIQNEDPAVRNSAVQALGLVCLLSKAIAQQHTKLFLQILQIDIDIVRITTAKALFDIMMIYGLDVFTTNEDTEQEHLASDSENKASTEFTSTNIISIFMELLDDKSSDICNIVVEGLGKLLINDVLSSTNLITNFIIMWYDPVRENNVHLRHFLGIFFPAFASSSWNHQECIAQAFLPTLQSIFAAPRSSSLSKINSQNVLKFLVELTRNRDEKEFITTEGKTTIHEQLAIDICKDILKEPDSSYIRVLVKTLDLLDLQSISVMKELSLFAEEILQTIDDVSIIKLMEKFQAKLSYSIEEETPIAEEKCATYSSYNSVK